jgi:hypothetical protein
MATSGSCSSTATSNSSALEASATTSTPSTRTNVAMPARSSWLSSAITTRTAAPL